MTKQIKYGDSSFTLRGEFGDDWDMANLTGVNITIRDTANTDLVAETAATLYTATTLGAASAKGDEYVALAGTPSAVSRGDRLYIAKSDLGPAETIVVHSYDSANKYVTAEDELKYSHSSGTAVKGMWATYAFDVSTVATYTKGKEIVVEWDPNTDDPAYTEQYVIGDVAAALPGFWSDFAGIYPAVWEIAQGRNIDNLEEQILMMFNQELADEGLDPDRIVDQNIIKPTLIKYARFIILADEPDEEHYKRSEAQWVSAFKGLKRLPIWQDLNQDGDLDDAEEETHDFAPIMRYI